MHRGCRYKRGEQLLQITLSTYTDKLYQDPRQLRRGKIIHGGMEGWKDGRINILLILNDEILNFYLEWDAWFYFLNRIHWWKKNYMGSYLKDYIRMWLPLGKVRLFLLKTENQCYLTLWGLVRIVIVILILLHCSFFYRPLKLARNSLNMGPEVNLYNRCIQQCILDRSVMYTLA